MARTEFTDEELRKQLFMELVKLPDNSRHHPGTVHFHGFFTDDALFRSRSARELAVRMRRSKDGEPLSMSEYLYFLAELFADIERQNEDRQKPSSGTPCLCGLRREEDCKGPKDCDNHVDRLLPNVSPAEALRPHRPETGVLKLCVHGQPHYRCSICRVVVP